MSWGQSFFGALQHRRIDESGMYRVHTNPELREINRMTLLDSLKTVPLALWDETRQRMISFREYRRTQAAAA